MLKGKTALVTGSTAGLGLALARRLAREGADVMLNGLGNAGAIERARAGIEQEFGVRVGWSGADLAQPAAVTGLVEYTVRRLGGIDILCHSAARMHGAIVERFAPEQWDSVVGVNLSAAFHAIRTAVPHMRKQGWGRIVNASCDTSYATPKRNAAAFAAQHGLIGLTRAVALETAGSGITCNVFCPRWILAGPERTGTERPAAATGAADGTAASGLADQIVFLCSDAASSVTGQALPLEGPWPEK
ncbi:MAG: SDR family oxidoreductase [Rhodospirillaceae bacterium]|nr:SDR family oxidoreductase [Rhodospirillaceae bacterium]